MSQVVLGTFNNRVGAEDAINSLEKMGYNPKDVSIVMKDTKTAEELSQNTGANVVGGAVSGATTGGVIGAIAGLLVGVGAIAVPGIGALLIGGPIAVALGLTGAAATTVSGAVTGALAGGLVGALVNIGVPEEDAKAYEQRVTEGAILVAVPTLEGRAMEVEDILRNNGADQIKSIDSKI